MLYSLLFIIICIFIYIIFNLNRKTLMYKSIINELQDRIDMDIEFISSINEKMIDTYENLNKSHLRTAFENDDEIGFYFEDIKSSQQSIVEFIQIYNDIILDDSNYEKTKTKK